MDDSLLPRSPLADLPDERTFSRTLRRVTLVPIFVLGLGIVVLLALVFFLLQSARTVERIDLEQSEVLLAEKLAVDMETSVRAFQLTGDDEFLQPYDEGRVRLDQAASRLAGDRNARGFTLPQAEGLMEHLTQWRAWATEGIRLRNEGITGSDVAFELQGKRLMDQVRRSAYRLAATLESDRKKHASVLRNYELAVITAVLVGGVLTIALSAGWLRSLLRRATSAYRGSLQAADRQIEQLKVLLSSIGDAVLATDAAQKIVFLNPVAEQLTGWSSADAFQKDLSEIFSLHDEETGEAIANPAAEALGKSETVAQRARALLRDKAGVERPVESSAAPIRSAGGKVLGAIVAFRDVGERRRQERALLVSEERYRRVFNLQFQFMAILSQEGRVLEVNDLFLRAAALSRDEVVGEYIWETAWYHSLPEIAKDWPHRLAQARAADEPIILLDRYRDTNEFIRYADTSITAVKGEDRHVLFFIVQASDCTDRHEAEHRLRQSERQFRFLNELMDATRRVADPAAIMKIVTEMTGRHLGVSRCAYAEVADDENTFTVLHDYTDGCASTMGEYRLDTFGKASAQSMRDGSVLILNDTQEEVEPDGRPMFEATGIRAIVCSPLLKDGRLRAMMAVHQTTPRRWTPEELALMDEVVERSWAYIEQVRIAAMLQAREEEVRLALSAAAMGTWDFHPLTGELRWDSRCRELFGMSQEQAVSYQAFEQALHPEDLDRVNLEVQTALAPHTGGRFVTEYRVAGDGGSDEYHWIRSIGQAFFNEHEAAYRFIGTVQDVTGRKRDEAAMKQAKEEAESASRAKDNFLAALSHELRTPLTPVLLTVAALRSDERLPEELKSDLSTLQRNVELEARLIDDLLDLTRIARGKLSLREQECDVHSLIGLAVEIVRGETERKQQRVTLDLKAERTVLMADPARLQQLFWNLLRNAVKFTPSGGQITVRTLDSDDGWICVEVADNGIGLEATALELIFKPFEQVGLTNDHRFGGLGLGLAIARAIAELHGGKVEASSEGHDKGSTFRVLLPKAGVGSSLTPGTPLPEQETTTATGKLRLLVVEDNEPTLDVLSRLLRRQGHTVTPAPNVTAALKAAGSGEFDAVVSDLGLPDGTGYDLMRTLHAQYGLSGVALTGYGMDEDIRRTKEAGFATHLVKPIDFELLREALRPFAALASARQAASTPQSP